MWVMRRARHITRRDGTAHHSQRSEALTARQQQQSPHQRGRETAFQCSRAGLTVCCVCVDAESDEKHERDGHEPVHGRHVDRLSPTLSARRLDRLHAEIRSQRRGSTLLVPRVRRPWFPAIDCALNSLHLLLCGGDAPLGPNGLSRFLFFL